MFPELPAWAAEPCPSLWHKAGDRGAALPVQGKAKFLGHFPAAGPMLYFTLKGLLSSLFLVQGNLLEVQGA